MAVPFQVRRLGVVPYEEALELQRRLVEERKAGSIPDQLLLLQHPPVITLGARVRSDRSHVLATEAMLDEAGVALFEAGRGGDVTYHGPGQLVVYPLIDMRRRGLGVRELVVALENGIIAMLASRNVVAVGRRDAPGIYVEGRKLASIGLRIRRGCSYHGLAFNVAMDLEPFRRINPCGYRGLEVIDLRTLGVSLELRSAAELLAPHLLAALGMPLEARWV